MLAFVQSPPPVSDAVRQAMQLAEIRALVERIAGIEGHGSTPDHSAMSAAYDRALPIVCKRFDAIAAAASDWAAEGVAALIAADNPPRAAAACLAQELAATERRLAALLKL